MTTPAPKEYYLFLDGFRAVAVLWVILHHIFVFFDLRPALGLLFEPLSKFAAVGVFGVDMFFVISGFLITGVLLDDFDKGTIRIKRFYTRRFLKIIPQYILTVLAGLILMIAYNIWGSTAAADQKVLGSIWINILLVQNYFDSLQLPTLAHLWTIAVEEQFYFVYPLLLALICAVLKTPRERRILLITICVILIFLGNQCRYAQIAAIIKAGHGYLHFQETHLHFDGLILGILIKLIEPYFYRFAQNKKDLFLAACTLGAVLIYSFFAIKGIDGFFWPTLGLAYLAPGLLITAALMRETSFLKYFAENKILRWIGKSSYATYLWHYILIFIFVENAGQHSLLNVVLVYIAATLLAGYISTQTIERYFLSLRGE